MKVQVMDLYNGVHLLDVSESDTVRMVKMKIESRTRIPRDTQVLEFRGNCLEDDCRLRNCNVKDGSVIKLTGRCFGGVPVGFDFNSMENQQVLGFAPAPIHRRIDSGINFLGTCKNTGCAANEDIACAIKGYGKFSIGRTIRECYCPLCGSNLKNNVTEAVMYRCRWAYEGYILDDDDLKQGSGSNDEADRFVYFGGDGNIKQWTCLDIEVTEY